MHVPGILAAGGVCNDKRLQTNIHQWGTGQIPQTLTMEYTQPLKPRKLLIFKNRHEITINITFTVSSILSGNFSVFTF